MGPYLPGPRKRHGPPLRDGRPTGKTADLKGIEPRHEDSTAAARFPAAQPNRGSGLKPPSGPLPVVPSKWFGTHLPRGTAAEVPCDWRCRGANSLRLIHTQHSALPLLPSRGPAYPNSAQKTKPFSPSTCAAHERTIRLVPVHNGTPCPLRTTAGPWPRLPPLRSGRQTAPVRTGIVLDSHAFNRGICGGGCTMTRARLHYSHNR
jgi:hypothetical protein